MDLTPAQITALDPDYKQRAEKLMRGVENKFFQLTEQACVTHAHIVRQVHFTGNHEGCRRRCYSIKASDFRTRVRELVGDGSLERPAAGRFTPNAIHNRRFAGQVKADGRRLGRTVDVPNVNTGGQATIRPRPLPAAGNPGAFEPALGTASLQGWTSNVGGTLAGNAAAPAPDTTGLNAADATGALAGTSEGLANVAAGTGIGLAIDMAVGWAVERKRRRGIRKSVFAHRRAVQVLLHDGDDADAARAELRALAEGGSDAAKADRVAQKIIWYLHKIHRLESQGIYRDLVEGVYCNRGFQQSVFSKCGQAADVWEATRCLWKQYDKLLTCMYFLEAILQQVDRKVANLDIGVPIARICREGLPTPRRPVHMS